MFGDFLWHIYGCDINSPTFFFNDTATTEIYTLSLHDALPICEDGPQVEAFANWSIPTLLIVGKEDAIFPPEVITEVQKVIPGSRMEVVPGAAHSAHFEQALVFNRLVDELFAGVLSGSVTGVAAD